MIVHELVRYWQVLKTMGSLPPLGFANTKINFVFNVDKTGKLTEIIEENKNQNVPTRASRTSGKKANLLWDNEQYALGIVSSTTKEKANKRDKNLDTEAKEKHNLFIAEIKKIDIPEKDMLVKFLTEELPRLKNDELKLPDASKALWKKIKTRGGNIRFNFTEFNTPVFDRQEVIDHALKLYITDQGNDETQKEGICSVSGKCETIARIHPKIKLPDAQYPGALITCNLHIFDSYGKTQGYNAAIGVTSALKTGAVLGWLLKSKQCIKIGNMWFIFFPLTCEQNQEFYAQLQELNPDLYNVDQKRSEKEEIAEHISKGKPAPKAPYMVLGFAPPHEQRYSLDYIHIGTEAQIGENMAQHKTEYEICNGKPRKSILTLMHYVFDNSANTKKEKDAVFTAIIQDTCYPESLLSHALQQVRKQTEDTSDLAALIKAILSRKNRLLKTNKKEITVGLDQDCTDRGYLLGRLLAVYAGLEYAVKRTSKDRCIVPTQAYIAAMCAPQAQVNTIAPKIAYWQKQLAPGLCNFYNEKIDDIMMKISTIPKELTKNEQAMYIIGYHHQRSALYTKRVKNNPEEEEN